MSILSIGILGVMQIGLLAKRNITSGDVVTQAVLKAQSEIEEIKAHRSLADMREKYPREPRRHGYFQISHEFVDPLADEREEPSKINCETSEYDGSGTCLVRVTVAWKRGGGGRGGSGEVVLTTMLAKHHEKK